MKVGIFGGSFDPVHIGHLWIAQHVIESLELDMLRWIPTATSPLKQAGPAASNDQRIEMLRLAISGNADQVIDDREIIRDGVSYTVDTVGELLEENPNDEFVLIIGSDSLATMRQWHEPEKLLRLVQLAVVQRGGESEVDFSVLKGMVDAARIESFKSNVIKMPVIEISSTEIRMRVALGRSIRHRVPRAVEAYIEASGLYRENAT